MMEEMMSDNPRVTVLVPTYNRPRMLRESLESLLLQERVHIELVLFDNGNENNGTREVINEMVKLFDNPVVIRRTPNSIDNISIMSSFVYGDYVVEFTDDDRMMKGNLATKIDKMLTDNTVICTSPVKCIDVNGLDLGVSKCQHDSDTLNFDDMFVTCSVSMPSVVMSIKAYRVKTNYILPIGCEWIRYLTLLDLGHKISNVETPLVELRIHDKSDTNIRGKGQGKFIDMHYQSWAHWLNHGYKPGQAIVNDMLSTYSGLLQERYGRGGEYIEGMKKLFDLINSVK